MNVAPPTTILSLFSGGGGLDLAASLAIPTARTVCYVEGDIQAAELLAARMEAGDVGQAPIWSDVATFGGRRWRGVVDLIVGGFPCQDISLAGRGAGIEGERSGLWGQYARIIRAVEPRLVFVENVAALTSRGLDRVLGEPGRSRARCGVDVSPSVRGGSPPSAESDLHSGLPQQRKPTAGTKAGRTRTGRNARAWTRWRGDGQRQPESGTTTGRDCHRRRGMGWRRRRRVGQRRRAQRATGATTSRRR